MMRTRSQKIKALEIDKLIDKKESKSIIKPKKKALKVR